MLEAYNTACVPVGQRFDHVRDALVDLPVPIQVAGGASVDIRAALRMSSFDQISVAVLDLRSDRPLRTERTARLIRRSDPEAYRLLLSLDGQLRCEQGEGRAEFRGGDLAVFDTSQPFVWVRGAGMRSCRMVMVTVPRRMIAVPARRVQPLLCRVLTTGPLTVVLGELLGCLADRLEAFERLDPTEVSELVGELLSGLLAQQADLSVPVGLAARGLLLRVGAVIVEQASDPRLRPRAIADELNTSVRTLHHAAREQNTTVMGMVRRHRLGRVREDPADPRPAKVSVAPSHVDAVFTDIHNWPVASGRSMDTRRAACAPGDRR